jgi:hypothetical protein
VAPLANPKPKEARKFRLLRSINERAHRMRRVGARVSVGPSVPHAAVSNRPLIDQYQTDVLLFCQTLINAFRPLPPLKFSGRPNGRPFACAGQRNGASGEGDAEAPGPPPRGPVITGHRYYPNVQPRCGLCNSANCLGECCRTSVSSGLSQIKETRPEDIGHRHAVRRPPMPHLSARRLIEVKSRRSEAV